MPDQGSFDAAVRHHQRGWTKEAEGLYREILRSDPNHAGAWHLLGVIRQQQELHHEALDLINRAISINPNKATYHNNHGAALFSLDRFTDAKASFQRALAIRPNYADAWANLGLAQAALGNDAAAEANFRRALGCRPWHRDAVKHLAGLLERWGRQEEAARLLESALAAAPCPEFDSALRKLRLATTQFMAAMHTSLVPRGDGGQGCLRRLLKDGTFYYTNDAQGNRTARFQSTTGLLDSTAANITIYAWDSDHCLLSIKSYANFAAYEGKIVTAEASFMRQDPNANGTSNEESQYDGVNLALGPHANPLPKGEGTARKIAFVSPHCLIDFTNGAATATMDGLELLAGQGFECQAFCGTRLDAWSEVLVEEILAREKIPYRVRNMQIAQGRGRMIFAWRRRVGVTMFNTASTRGGWVDRGEFNSFLAACEVFLRKNRPDLVWTYGGSPVSASLYKIVHGLGIPLLFALHNFKYRDPSIFQTADRVIVPTEYARRFYHEGIALECEVLPLVVDPERVKLGIQYTSCAENGKWSVPNTFVTFVNPEPRKGVHVFARIAEVLARRRPDIPLLLVEGTAKMSSLPMLRVDLAALKNLTIWPNTPNARKIYAASKLILMPSLMENAGFVAMEAMTNGIPVLGSNRGGLPETIGDAAPVIDIPARYTPETRDVPAAEEVAPWVEMVIRLWDDAAEYDRWSRAARERAQRWHPDRLAPIYRDFFGSIARQPGSRLAPKDIASG